MQQGVERATTWIIGGQPHSSEAINPSPHSGMEIHRNEKGKKSEHMETYFGTFLGLRPSTMHTCPPDLHRLHVFTSFGKSHFIYDHICIRRHDKIA